MRPLLTVLIESLLFICPELCPSATSPAKYAVVKSASIDLSS